ncbi:MAG: hypothetical protein QMC81_08840 [Thermoanaerobacterales bacterium]|nr:hypothetical protein [Thermoanaerobacterales bacterium]
MSRYLLMSALAAVVCLLSLWGCGWTDGERGKPIPAPRPAAASVTGSLSSDEEDVRRLVGEAVKADNYLSASSRDELRTCLGRIYAGPLLERLTDAVWECWGSDNTGGAVVTDWLELRFDGSQAYAAVALYSEDWATGDRVSGQGRFTLMRLTEGWRVVDIDYCWE